MSISLHYYDRRWTTEDKQDTAPSPGRVKLVVDSVFQQCSRPPERIIDVGCGNGWILDELNKRINPTTALYGIEPSRLGVENTLRRVPQADVRVGTLTSVHFPHTFPLVISSEVIEHVQEQVEFIRQIARITEPGGIFILTTPNGNFRETFFQNNPNVTPQPVENWLTPHELCTLTQSYFSVSSLTSFNLGHFYETHNTLNLIRSFINRAPSGSRIRSRIDRAIGRHLLGGLGILGIFRRHY